MTVQITKFAPVNQDETAWYLEDVIASAGTHCIRCGNVVYCVNCGTKNPDDSVTCTQCGRSILRVETGRTRREQEMCFGMPSHWGGILVGAFIVVLGLILFYQQFAHVSWDVFGPLILIFFGIVVLLGGFYRYSRR